MRPAGIKKAAKGVWDDLTGKKYLHASDFTNGIAGHVIDLQKDALKAKAASLEEQAAKFEDNYLNSPGGSDQAKLNEELRFNNMMEASDVEGDVADLAKIGSKIPVLGLAISAVGVGWDIAHGKPAGQAIFSGAAGTAAAFGADALTTAAIGASGFEAATGAGALLVAAGPVGVGIIAGVGVGLAADYAWNHWVPTNVKNDINNGLTDVGHGIAHAADAVGHFFSSL
ncbi:MAG TPA: hypothetical protein VHX38_03700 [Pseudonocardiaceae bacterium]|jgi:hypothetical protein|nr:hypothetical protein [Pseudonocardiaceae bacterium]